MRAARKGLVLALLTAAACAPRSPEGVADKFVDFYFVEIDQGRALPLTMGLAHDILERELRDVAAIRKQMGYMPADARPDVYYRRIAAQPEGERQVFAYDITLKHEHDVMRKSARVAVTRDGDGRWKVVFFRVYEGEAPQRPPG